MPSSPDYAKRILDETRRSLDPRVLALQVAFNSLKNHLLTSLDQLTPQLEAIQGIELPNAEGIVTEAMKESAWQNQVEVNLLAEFANGMRRKETQEEILSLLLDTADQFAHGVALFVVRGDEIAGWSSRGFSPDTAARFGSCSFPVGESALLQKALGGDVILTVAHPPEEARLQEIFQDEQLISWHFLPMKALQRRIAVLIACDSGARICNLDSLRILMDITSLCVENLALKILQELRSTEPSAPESAVEASAGETAPAGPPSDAFRQSAQASAPVVGREEPPFKTAERAEPAASAEPAMEYGGSRFHAETQQRAEVTPEPTPAHQTEAAPLQYAEESESAFEPIASRLSGEKSAPGGIEPAPRPMERLESPGLAEAVSSAMSSIPPVAAQPVEVPLQAMPSPSIQQRAVTPAIEEPAIAPVAKAAASALPPEEEKLQADARRFARLLVSEIKLYNEQRLVEARSGGQIYIRLKRDIDRSREMYEKRFPSASSHRADHFHEELVRILAENDPAKLGGEYPGPRVES